jgi:hypothetical protein
MSAQIPLARSSPGPVEADWETDAYAAERRRRIRSYNSSNMQLTMADDVTGESHAGRSVKPSVAETAPATLIRADRRPRWYEKGAHDDGGDQVEGPDERVIWSPFRLQRRRRDRETLAALASRSATR